MANKVTHELYKVAKKAIGVKGATLGAVAKEVGLGRGTISRIRKSIGYKHYLTIVQLVGARQDATEAQGKLERARVEIKSSNANWKKSYQHMLDQRFKQHGRADRNGFFAAFFFVTTVVLAIWLIVK